MTASADQHLLPPGVRRRFYHAPAADLGLPSSAGSGTSNSPNLPEPFDLFEPGPGRPANQVASLCSDGLHRPLFDYDHREIQWGLAATEAVLRVPSRKLVAVRSTSNWHIYVPTVACTWPELVEVLGLAHRAGVIDSGYLGLSLRDGVCYLRPPGHYKNSGRDQVPPSNLVRAS